MGILALSSVLATVSRGRGHVLPVRWVLFGFVSSRVMQDRTVSRWPRDSGARMRNSCKVARTSVFVPVFQRKVPNPPQCQDAQVQGDWRQVSWTGGTAHFAIVRALHSHSCEVAPVFAVRIRCESLSKCCVMAKRDRCSSFSGCLCLSIRLSHCFALSGVCNGFLAHSIERSPLKEGVRGAHFKNW